MLIGKHKCVYGDFTLTEFDDPILSDNVVSVSLSDAEHLILDRKVGHPYCLNCCNVFENIMLLRKSKKQKKKEREKEKKKREVKHCDGTMNM